MTHTDIDWTSPPRLRLGGLGLIQAMRPPFEVLVVEKAYKSGRARYGLPGGCAREGEDAQAACAREIEEELGIKVVPGALLAGHYMPAENGNAAGQNLVFDCGQIDADTSFTLGAEITRAVWLSPGDAVDMLMPYQMSRINAALGGQIGEPTPYLVGHP